MSPRASGALPLAVVPPAVVLFFVVQWVAHGSMDAPFLEAPDGDALLSTLHRGAFFGTLALVTPLLALLAGLSARPRPAPAGRP